MYLSFIIINEIQVMERNLPFFNYNFTFRQESLDKHVVTIKRQL